MGKYVAFLDILGFKSKLKQLGHAATKQYISSFSSTAYNEWNRYNPKLVKGYIVSDSFIIYSENTTKAALIEMTTIIDRICKKEFSENKILIRGAIAKGEFERIPAIELSSLSKGLMVGQAYVDAYSLENAAKVAGIILTSEVYTDINELDKEYECTEEKTTSGINYILSYLDYEFLLESNNMQTYVDLASAANWLPHYYNTLYLAIKSEKNSRKVTALFEKILSSIGDPSEYWQETDKFIENAFDQDVVHEFKKRFLKYLRQQIGMRKEDYNLNKVKLSNQDRVLKFIEERGHLTISQISSNLNISTPTVSRIIRNLSDEGMIENTAMRSQTSDSVTRYVNTYSIKYKENL